MSSEKTIQIEVRDLDFIFGQNDAFSVTLKPGETIDEPTGGLGAPGEFRITLASGEVQRINAASVQCVSMRKRMMTIKAPQDSGTAA